MTTYYKERASMLWELLDGELGDENIIPRLIDIFGSNAIKEVFPENFNEWKEDEEEKKICCVGCGKDGLFLENRDGDTMCEGCMDYDSEEEDDKKVKCSRCMKWYIYKQRNIEEELPLRTSCDECLDKEEEAHIN